MTGSERLISIDRRNSGFLFNVPEGGLSGLLFMPAELPSTELPPKPLELFIQFIIEIYSN